MISSKKMRIRKLRTGTLPFLIGLPLTMLACGDNSSGDRSPPGENYPGLYPPGAENNQPPVTGAESPPPSLSPSPEPVAPVADQAGTECTDGQPGDFTKDGPYGFASKKSGSYTLYTPRDFGRLGCKTPLVAFAMGTGAPAIGYTQYYLHMASWGFTVVVDTSNILFFDGESLKTAIDTVYADPEFGPHLAPVAGTMGHSQGGAAAINATRNPRVRATVGLMPATLSVGPREGVAGLYLGGGQDNWGIVTDPDVSYNFASGPAYSATVPGADHVIAAVFTEAGNYKAVSTAWFRCHLSGDPQGCHLFAIPDCSRFPGEWIECKSKNL